MDYMINKVVPQILPEIKYIDVSNEEYEKIMNLFQPERLNPETQEDQPISMTEAQAEAYLASMLIL